MLFPQDIILFPQEKNISSMSPLGFRTFQARAAAIAIAWEHSRLSVGIGSFWRDTVFELTVAGNFAAAIRITYTTILLKPFGHISQQRERKMSPFSK